MRARRDVHFTPRGSQFRAFARSVTKRVFLLLCTDRLLGWAASRNAHPSRRSVLRNAHPRHTENAANAALELICAASRSRLLSLSLASFPSVVACSTAYGTNMATYRHVFGSQGAAVALAPASYELSGCLSNRA
jgi:hypothetical protein